MSIWDYFDEHPADRETFARAMMGVTVQQAPVVARIYPFAELRSICDVGGGSGTLLSEILLRHPNLTGVLFDVPGVISSAERLLRSRGVLERVRLEGGSIFEKVPSGADAYLLKNVLHDWDDARCLHLLGRVREAMAPGQRILLVESLQERNDTKSLTTYADLQMMVQCSEGRERSQEELQALLRDSGFQTGRVFEHPIISVIEGVRTQ
jgi:hypothetical protein